MLHECLHAFLLDIITMAMSVIYSNKNIIIHISQVNIFCTVLSVYPVSEIVWKCSL